ncbi:MAG: ABC transporter permease, partial [Cyanobacteriota bacterium]|nr:ABC transporter permease [Cyanobacteriota bacterium]
MATGTVPLRETAAMAVATLKGHRLRSLLTMLGIVIGNASVITLVGLGKGAQRLADQQLNSLGPNVLFIVPGRNDTRRQGLDSPKTLILEDAEAIAEQVPSVRRVAPQISLMEVVQAGSQTASATVTGVTPDFLGVRSFEIAKGRFISESDIKAARNIVVLGPDLKDKIFPTGEAIGKRLRIRDQSF